MTTNWRSGPPVGNEQEFSIVNHCLISQRLRRSSKHMIRAPIDRYLPNMPPERDAVSRHGALASCQATVSTSFSQGT